MQSSSQPNLAYRPIRSFVHRQVGLSKQRAWALKTLLPQYSLPTHQGRLNLEQVYCRSAPVILEIGFGMGQSLLQQAQKYPEKNFLGIEVHRPGIAALLLGLETFKLNNLKVFYGDTKEILASCISDQSLTAIQIFFPDPWPKRRHHKRRLIQSEFAELLQRKLIPKGQLLLATDWKDYAQQMLAVLENTAGLKNCMGSYQFAPRPLERTITKFERRGQLLGYSIWDLVFYACGGKNKLTTSL